MSGARPIGLSPHVFVRDPFGHRWALCTNREVLDPDEVAQRTPARIPPRPGTA